MQCSQTAEPFDPSGVCLLNCINSGKAMGKGILLWLLGIPVPVIVILGFALHWW
jgi:hypothetical protein